jgi:hypothetical protein
MAKLTASYGADRLPDGNDQRAARGDRRQGRAPRHDIVMFMHNAITCHACHLLQTFEGNIVARSLYVAVSGNHLVVTEADDLHVPGRSLCAQRIMDLASVTVYRLLGNPLPGVDPAQHAPAAGIAILSWSGGRRRLKVTGVAEGFAAHHDCLFDALEKCSNTG